MMMMMVGDDRVTLTRDAQEYEYELTVFNVLQRVATGITVTDFLPEDLLYVRYNSTPHSGALNCSTAANNAVTCTLSRLDALESVTITIVVLVNNSASAKLVRNIASASSTMGDFGESASEWSLAHCTALTAIVRQTSSTTLTLPTPSSSWAS